MPRQVIVNADDVGLSLSETYCTGAWQVFKY